MKRVLVVSLLLVQFFIAEKILGQVVLPQIIRDSMVLQRDARIRVWGWAAPGEKIKIKFNRKELKTNAGADGKWMVYLPSMGCCK